MENPITQDNVFDVDIPKLALDPRFGSLIFISSEKKLSKIQAALKEAHDLGFQELLPQPEISVINSRTNNLVTHLEWLRNFDIGAVSNAKDEHTNFNNRIDALYNDVHAHILMGILPFLREERRRENPDQKQFDNEIKKVIQLRTDLEDELKNVRNETQHIRATSKEVGTAKGERATARLASHFDNEVTKYFEDAKKWFYAIIVGYIAVIFLLVFLGVSVLSFSAQLSLLSATSTSLMSSTTVATLNSSMIWGAIVSKLVILTALWYGLSFIIKNYNVNSHLSAVNRHRAAVARTLEDFIAIEQQQQNPRLSEMLQNATDAMFKNAPIGYITKAEKESSNPVLQIINDLVGAKNTG